jgi:hypothetical protein
MPYKKLMPADNKSTGNETAIDLIYNFLNEPALRGLSDLAMGGTFPLSYFQLGNGSCAKQFWYCYDKSRTQQEVYLAIEDSPNEWPRNRKAAEIPTTPESEILHRPTTSFTFDDLNFDRTDIAQVDQFIQHHKDENQSSRTISRAEVKNFGETFIAQFGGKKEEKEFCYYPMAYFENFVPETGQRVIDDFLKIGNIHYVRYYFGLETAKGHGANRIRVVLFPVGKEQVRVQAVGGSNDVLQFSWPPIGDEAFANDSIIKRGGIKQEEYSWASQIENTIII